MDDNSNTTDLESTVQLEADDREYYCNAGHIVQDRPSRQQQLEDKLMIQAGLVA